MSMNELNEYPRPQFERKDWVNLNGSWNFEFDDNNIGETEHWFEKDSLLKKINVPFVYECKASGVNITEHHENVWYQRKIQISKLEPGKHVFLNFQGVDYCAKVWVNGHFVGKHEGANTAFRFDITYYAVLGGINNIVVKAEDSTSCYQPRGKQRWMDHNFLCWYVQSTGIWKTVWMEYVEETHIQEVKITPDLDHQSVKFEYNFNALKNNENLTLKTRITYKDHEIQAFNFKVTRDYMEYTANILDDSFTQKILFWTPQKPNLYQVHFTLSNENKAIDEVDSYFGMRKISISDGKIFLNDQEIYQKLVLEQGFWPETMFTPPSDEAICKEIDCICKMGFNGIRLHQKIEDDRFLYYCDQKGLLVWSEMAAAYSFSDEAVTKFTEEWMQIVKQQYNHPCIITWTPFNESWGVPNIRSDKKQQKFTESIYYLTKSIDPMRPVITNDGWEHTISDIITIHDYEEDSKVFFSKYADKEKVTQEDVMSGSGKRLMADGFVYHGQPVIISECGGTALKGTAEQDGSWGYGKNAENQAEFLKRYADMLNSIKAQKYIVGYCYTQLTDVQQEQNGLYNPDRTPKIDPGKIKDINSI